MMFLVALGLLARGALADTQPSGISQFWTDDYKVFEQIYGKTSDRSLYDTNIPIVYTNQESQEATASEKKERLPYHEEVQVRPSASPISGKYGDKYAASLLDEQQYILKHLKDAKSTKPTYKFIGYNEYKPISLSNNPETYKYIQHLEQLEKQQPIGFPQDGIKGFKPYTTYGASPTYVTSGAFTANPAFGAANPVYGSTNPAYGSANSAFESTHPENTDAYKSIQDILDAHEANKSKGRKYKENDEGRYATYENRPKKISGRYVQSNDISKTSRCSGGAGRCRKRAPYPSRSRPRPVVRKIKHTIISD